VYQHKDLRDQLRTKAPAPVEEAAKKWARQWGHPPPPLGRIWAQHYFPGHPGTGPTGAGPAGVDLEVAMAAGRAAIAAGFGPSRADGLYGCGRCPGCTFGGPGACRKPQSKAMAQLRHGQAAADRLDQAEDDLAELQRTIWREVNRRGQLT
jgi:hypothetical protein